MPSMPVALVALRADHPSHVPEPELVTVERRGERVEVVLDDGVVLSLDAHELAHAVAGPRLLWEAA